MFIAYPIIVMCPLVTINLNEPPINNLIPYQSYTTTSLMSNDNIKVYERFWNSIIKEDIEINNK